MNEVKVTDELLYKYMPIVDKTILNRLSENVEEVTFSKGFEKKINKLIRKERYKRRNVKLWKLGSKASVLITLVGITVFLAIINTAYGGHFISKIVKTFFEGSVLMQYHTEKDPEGFIPYYITELPEGYEKIDEDLNEYGNYCLYENANRDFIVYDQMLIIDGMSFIMDSEYDDEERCIINNIEVIFYIRYGGYIKAYLEKDMNVITVICSEINKEMLINIVESIK